MRPMGPNGPGAPLLEFSLKLRSCLNFFSKEIYFLAKEIYFFAKEKYFFSKEIYFLTKGMYFLSQALNTGSQFQITSNIFLVGPGSVPLPRCADQSELQ